MRTITTDGIVYEQPDMCAYCRITTGGEHEKGCPCDSSNTHLLSEEEETNMLTKITINTAFDFWDNEIDNIWNDV